MACPDLMIVQKVIHGVPVCTTVRRGNFQDCFQSDEVPISLDHSDCGH